MTDAPNSDPMDLMDFIDATVGEALADDGLPCAACGGPLTFLGVLGGTIHFRCRDCGLDQSMERKECEVSHD